MRSTTAYLIAASLAILAFIPISCRTSDAETQDVPKEIVQKLHIQEQAWNEGNLDVFMGEAYWASDSLMFIGSQGLTFGHDATLANYHKSYPNPEAMGKLTFELRQWRRLGKSHGLLVGSWHLERSNGLSNLDGHFSLTWEHFGNDWVIIADHSS